MASPTASFTDNHIPKTTFMTKSIAILFAASLLALPAGAQKRWTLAECVEYATQNNISLQKARANIDAQAVGVAERRNAWLPTVSAAVQQGLNWRPISESEGNFVNGGISASSASRATYSGSYGVNASWTAWDGGRIKMNIENAELSKSMAEMALSQSTESIAEQIAQLYVQVLYMEEALKVNEQLLERDKTIYQRGTDMVEQGQMSRSDLVQLEAQVASGEYDVVNTRTQIAQVKLSLKQLLELAPEDDIEVVPGAVSDERASALIADKMAVYEVALENRPEIKSAQLGIEQSRLARRLAKAQRMPTVSLGAGLTDSHMSGSTNMGKQLRNNLATSISAGLQVPIFDQHQTRTAIQRAEIGELTAKLDLMDAEKKLYQTIEQYWLNATNSQQKFIASKAQIRSAQTNYLLVEDQFKVGLKTTVDLLQSRSSLLTAQQSNLQDKYNTVLNMLLLDHYQGKSMSL